MAAGRLVGRGIPGLILGSLAWFHDHDLFHLAAYCIMPDHVHVLFQLGETASLPNIMQRFGSFTGLQVYRQTGRGGLWALGYHDHALRPETAIADVVAYIEHNPVKAGLAPTAADWPWSSVHLR